MLYCFFCLAWVLIGVGAYLIYNGLPLLRVEYGMSQFLSGVCLICAGILTIVLTELLKTVRSIALRLKSTQESKLTPSSQRYNFLDPSLNIAKNQKEPILNNATPDTPSRESSQKLFSEPVAQKSTPEPMDQLQSVSSFQNISPEPVTPNEDAAEKPPLEVIGTYQSGDHTYIMYADGSIEAHLEEGVYKFESIEALKSYIETKK